MKPAELRRAYEELVSAYRTLESQNVKLREENSKLKRGGAVSTSTATPPKPSVREGSLVDYIDERGHAHVAVVKEVLDKGILKVRVFRQARADLVLDVAPYVSSRAGWRVRSR